MPKLLFFITEDWYFCSHRLPLAREAIEAGFEVTLLTNVQSHGDLIRSAGVRVIPLDLKRSSLNPFRELTTIWRVIVAYRSIRPDIVHHVAMKPVLYGSIAALIARIPYVVNALAGMGYLFISQNLKARMLRGWIKQVFGFILGRNGSRLILQNPDDRNLLVSNGIVKEDKISLIKGAGVNLNLFKPTIEPDGIITVVLASRMLWDKGVGEFVKASAMLKAQGVSARFVLVGSPDLENPRSIPEITLLEWHKSNVIEWWGKREDMPEVFAKTHIICLPTTYGEGIPKVLIEAAACGRPIVTTDAPGCREIVRDRVNGFLVPARNAVALAAALRKLINDRELREEMGAKGRQIVMEEFSEEKVVAETMAVYRELLAR